MEPGIALYIRLSMADEDTGKGKDESNSIVNQRNLIHQFLDAHSELSKIPRTEFVDDGFTGTNMMRPAFQDMIRQIREGRFNICITKDFSRFSRDYIEIGDYLECLFPFLRVRYISINDGYDSKEYKGTTGGLEVVMRNIVYAAYSKDLSAKEVAGKRQSMKKGRRASGGPAYGYLPDPYRKSMDVIDPEAARIVRKIFDLAISGRKVGDIARTLNDEGIPTPAVYFQKKHPESGRYRNLSEQQRWNYSAVLKILRRYSYTGASVGHLRRLVVPCGKSTVKVEKEDQIIVPGMHEAIVTVKEYEAAQKVIKSTGYTRVAGNEYPLKSLVICGNCGRHMTRCNKNKIRFKCPHGRHDRDSACKKYRSPLEVEMEEIVFSAIRNFISLADGQQSRSKVLRAKQEAETQAGIESMTALRGRIDLLKKEKLEAYEKYCAGKLDKEAYIYEKVKFDEKIAECEKVIQENEEQVKKLEQSLLETGSELERAVSVYREESRLTSDMARAFIEKIVVHQEEQIEIKWRFEDCFSNGRDEKNST